MLYLATFVFSIVGLSLYSPVLHPPKFMAGAGGDTRVRLGLACEVLLVIANVGTAVVIFPILRRRQTSETAPAAEILKCSRAAETAVA